MTLALAVLVASAAFLAWVLFRQARRQRSLEELLRRAAQGEDASATGGDSGPLGRAIRTTVGAQRRRISELERELDERDRILAHLDAGVGLLDESGRLVHVNHALANLLGRPVSAALGRPLVELVRTPGFEELVRRCRAERRTVESEVRLWTPLERSLRATATPLGDDASLGVMLVVHDLSEAERLNRMRQDFVANVSHELRTPLTSLRGYTETLLEGGLDDVEHRERFVRIIRDQTARLQDLVQDLLALAELERGDAELRPEPFDLRELARTVVASFREPAERRRLALALAPGASVPVEAERPRLEQVLANLVDNGIKYTEQGGVTVRVGVQDGVAWGEVEDTGPGIPEEHLPRIFERFYRVDPGRSRDRGSTGLGLSIVRHAIERHGGRVTVTSRRGAGCVFRFELPARQRPIAR